jgi:hypothetical protein
MPGTVLEVEDTAVDRMEFLHFQVHSPAVQGPGVCVWWGVGYDVFVLRVEGDAESRKANQAGEGNGTPGVHFVKGNQGRVL